MPAEWTDAEFELLSAYIDEQLDDNDRTALEARLAQNADLRQELAAMRQTVALLHSLPTIRAPRAFTLTPEMVGQTAVPMMTVVQPLTAEAKTIRPLPTRRVWWIPAASAAGVVLLAGVLLVTQTGPMSAPTSGAVQEVAIASTTLAPVPTSMAQGSALNTVVQDVVPQSPVMPPSSQAQSTSLSTSTSLPTQQPTDVPRGGETGRETDNEASDGAADTNLAPSAPIISSPVVQGGAPQPAPLDIIEQQESAPRFEPSATIDAVNNQQSAPGQSPAETADESQSDGAVIMSTAGPVLEASTGSGGGNPITAVTGMDGINPDPAAPGFTVATMSPLQVTDVALYNAPQTDTGFSATSAENTPDSAAKRDPIWIRWAKTLSEWLEQLFALE